MGQEEGARTERRPPSVRGGPRPGFEFQRPADPVACARVGGQQARKLEDSGFGRLVCVSYTFREGRLAVPVTVPQRLHETLTAPHRLRSAFLAGKSLKTLMSKGILQVHPPICDCPGCRISSPVVRRGR